MKNLRESFEVGDLKSVLEPKIHIDEFKSKMGKDPNIIVISLLVNDKQAAIDLVDFIERGYDWILDCDLSDSEIKPGSYLVFIEVLRRRIMIEQLFRLLSDLSAASQLNINDWKFRYMNDKNYHKLTAQNIKEFVPLSPRAYTNYFDKPIDDIKKLAGMATEGYYYQDELIETLKHAAGLPINNKNSL